MKFFNVIAVLCSFFVVVNGELYTFKLSDANSNFPRSEGVQIRVGGATHDMIWNSTEGKYIFSINLEQNPYLYQYTFPVNQWDFDYEVTKKRSDTAMPSPMVHPCLITEIGRDRDSNVQRTLLDRFIESEKREYDDVNGEPPDCLVGYIQCNQFVYKVEDQRDADGVGQYHCRSIGSNSDIYTLNTLLAESTEFNNDCFPN